MKIQCPNCKKITELEHVDHGSQVECVCSCIFTVDESSITEEFTEVDSKLPVQIGQYPITGFIGFGGMGKVYLARHPNLGIPVAIKALRMEYMTDRAACDRFVQSAKICARINHPNIVRIYDCGYENDNVYLVMEYISGGSTLELLEQEGKLAPEHAAFIMLEVCSGLMEAEKYGIVHRDIKPENIMFDQEGTVKILDLGLSKIIGDRRISPKSITASLTALGTPLYMAPEQAVDAANCDSRADIYSIGVSLYQLCTGKLPFDSEDPHELRRMHALEKPVPPSRLEPGIRPDMERIILHCMEKKREDRYPSITDLALDLEAYLKNRILPSTLRRSESAGGRNRRPGSFFRRLRIMVRKAAVRMRSDRRILRGIAAAAAGLICLASGIVWAWHGSSPEEQRPDPMTQERILAELSRTAALYLEDQDYHSVIRLYRNYHGPLAAETRRERKRIADGYLLTCRQTAENLKLELAELLLRGKFREAWNVYEMKKGRIWCSECEEILRELTGMPAFFRNYWNSRIGQTFNLVLKKRGKIKLKIVEVRNSGVYALTQNTNQLVFFTLDDFPPESQLQIMREKKTAVRDLWAGLCCLRLGDRKKAAELLRRVPVFKQEFARLLAGNEPTPESAPDSARSR